MWRNLSVIIQTWQKQDLGSNLPNSEGYNLRILRLMSASRGMNFLSAFTYHRNWVWYLEPPPCQSASAAPRTFCIFMVVFFLVGILRQSLLPCDATLLTTLRSNHHRCFKNANLTYPLLLSVLSPGSSAKVHGFSLIFKALCIWPQLAWPASSLATLLYTHVHTRMHAQTDTWARLSHLETPRNSTPCFLSTCSFSVHCSLSLERPFSLCINPVHLLRFSSEVVFSIKLCQTPGPFRNCKSRVSFLCPIFKCSINNESNSISSCNS